MHNKVLISAPYMHKEKEKILKMLPDFSYEVDWVSVIERLEEKDLLPIISKYHGILCGDDRITQKVIDAATNLRVIVKWGTGIDSIDKEYVESKGIKVFRTPGAFTEPVSDTTIALMLNETRGIARNDKVVKTAGWDKPQGYTLHEKTIGIIGFGEIGQAVARKLLAFGPKVLVNDVKDIDSLILSNLNARSVSKETIYDKCDIITLHCDLNSTSKHLLSKDTFTKMKRKPYIINTARGPIIKEQDLIEALNNDVISGAGLDVFEDEPLATDSPLRGMNNVTMSCHNSNSSPECWDKVHLNSLKMMEEGLKVK
ncbi:MAG: NAD(P)-binding domain-containing protein [Candidatus Vogelbacteria bacterium]|nr:NAD(P)-binding domain-containing protein [Candidatus Vogelbacteria bacterium]